MLRLGVKLTCVRATVRAHVPDGADRAAENRCFVLLDRLDDDPSSMPLYISFDRLFMAHDCTHRHHVQLAGALLFRASENAAVRAF